MQEEADKIAGTDPDWATRDLYERIERGNYPKWELSVQVMHELEAESYRWNPFDLTKVWPHGDYPLIKVGIMELNRNPKNYFAEVEQAAFDPSNKVPGISFSPDKMLQARTFSYADAHRYRLGVNYQSLPVNRPKKTVSNYHRDGFMRFDGNYGGSVVYEPNSFGGPQQDPAFKEPPLKISGDADAYDQPTTDDDFVQPGNLYRLLPPDEQDRLIQNLVNSLKTVPKFIQERMLKHFLKADSTWGERIKKELNL